MQFPVFRTLNKANELKDLVAFLKTLDCREKIHIIGAGSNTLIRDGGFDGAHCRCGQAARQEAAEICQP